MNTLIVGRFHQLSDAEAASRELARAGFLSEEMGLVYVNPHGQHATHPVGGDKAESPGTHDATSGAVRGAAGGAGAGTLLGAAAIPALGPAGPLMGAAVGAYTGALVGALKHMEDGDGERTPVDADGHADPLPHEPGFLLAVALGDAARRDRAVDILRTVAEDVEEAEGILRDGDWIDFDPLAAGKPIA
ncbi:MAG: hypothetical protein M0Z73_01645 [Betaproteobacteria bacterium]|nr:hypothetical protein [Betaproteobacteria bacterium]